VIWAINQYVGRWAAKQEADEINWCPSFSVNPGGWPLNDHTYTEEIVPPNEIPEDGYEIVGPHRSIIARIYYDKNISLFSLMNLTTDTEERCYLPEGGLIMAINNVIFVRDGILHVLTNIPE